MAESCDSERPWLSSQAEVVMLSGPAGLGRRRAAVRQGRWFEFLVPVSLAGGTMASAADYGVLWGSLSLPSLAVLTLTLSDCEYPITRSSSCRSCPTAVTFCDDSNLGASYIMKSSQNVELLLM